MYILLTVLIIIVAILLMLVVLIQNPKGGGLGTTFGGSMNSNLIGFKRTTDILEKATWTLVIVLISLTLLTNLFVEREVPQQQETELEGEVAAPMDNNFPVMPGEDIPDEAPALPEAP